MAERSLTEIALEEGEYRTEFRKRFNSLASRWEKLCEKGDEELLRALDRRSKDGIVAVALSSVPNLDTAKEVARDIASKVTDPVVKFDRKCARWARRINPLNWFSKEQPEPEERRPRPGRRR